MTLNRLTGVVSQQSIFEAPRVLVSHFCFLRLMSVKTHPIFYDMEENLPTSHLL